MSAREWLAKRAELEAAATEGPWESDDADPSIWSPKVIVLGNYTAADDYNSPAWEDGSPGDRAFIADARTSAPAMRKALEAVLKLWPDADPCEACVHAYCEVVRAVTDALGVES